MKHIVITLFTAFIMAGCSTAAEPIAQPSPVVETVFETVTETVTETIEKTPEACLQALNEAEMMLLSAADILIVYEEHLAADQDILLPAMEYGDMSSLDEYVDIMKDHTTRMTTASDAVVSNNYGELANKCRSQG